MADFRYGGRSAPFTSGHPRGPKAARFWRSSTAGASRSAATVSSTYRSQTAASELAATQINAHNPTDNSVITVSDAIPLSRITA